MDVQQQCSRERARTAAAWSLLAVGLCLAFYQNFVNWMWLRWFPSWTRTDLGLYARLVDGESYYTHGPLVPLVSLLICLLLVRHTRIRVRPSPRLGWAVLGISVLLHWMARWAHRIEFASGYALIGVLVGLVLVLWGREALRRLWFPLIFLAFMVPLPEETIYRLNFRLKMLAADVGVALANFVGIIAEQSGNRVFLGGGKALVVANVCNGLRTLMSLLAFGALYVYVCRLRGAWRLLLFGMTVPVALVSNSIRIVTLIVIADLWSVEAATGWYHDTSGVLIFVAAFLMMFGLERLILWVRQFLGRPAGVEPLFHSVRRGPADETQWSRMVAAVGSRTGAAAAAAVLLTAAGSWYLGREAASDGGNGSRVGRALQARLTIGGRQLYGYEMTLDRRTLTILGTDDYVYRRYAGGAPEYVDLCVIFSEDNRKAIHPPDVCLEGAGEGIIAKASVAVEVEGVGVLPLRELIVQTAKGEHCFLYTYQCGSAYTASFWRQQLAIFLNGLLKRDATGALIRVSTPIATDPAAGLRQCRAEARRRCAELLCHTIPLLRRAG